MGLSLRDVEAIRREKVMRKLEIHTDRFEPLGMVRPNDYAEFLWSCLHHADKVGDEHIADSIYLKITKLKMERDGDDEPL